MAKMYRVNFAVRASNWLMTLLLRAGVKLGPSRFPIVLLTVRGRKSGQPRSTPVVTAEYKGQRYLIGPFGNVNWVRNLRAAGEATLTRERRSEHISVVELTPAEAAPFLKEILATPYSAQFTRGYFDVTADSSLEAFEREATRHPVFLVRSAMARTSEAARETTTSGSSQAH